MENKLIAKNNKGEIVEFKIGDIGGYTFFSCSKSNLTEIISIPNIQINDLFFTGNKLTSLPENLPKDLEFLYCWNNKMKQLPNLIELQKLREVCCDIQCFEDYMLEMKNTDFYFYC